MTGTVTWPSGVTSAAAACGIKGAGELDLGVLVAERPVTWAGVFTRNAAAAPCVHWSRALLGRPLRAVVVNSGNANACTGSAGATSVTAAAAAVAAALRCSPQEVAVASTGKIGAPLDVGRIAGAVPGALRSLNLDPLPFARSIMTTDTHPKVAACPAGDAVVVGVAKGAAMLAPNMATMLSFLVTDAAVDVATLQTMLWIATDTTFNRLCIDACESTNDSVFLLATGRAGPPGPRFQEALTQVCADLAGQMAADTEGGSRVLRVRVAGTDDDEHALTLARAVAGSVLWRAAVHGGDANWGRVLAALGAADRALDLTRVRVDLSGTTVFARGERAEAPAFARPAPAAEVVVACTVGGGPGSAEVLSAGLSPSYVELNASGTS